MTIGYGQCCYAENIKESLYKNANGNKYIEITTQAGISCIDREVAQDIAKSLSKERPIPLWSLTLLNETFLPETFSIIMQAIQDNPALKHLSISGSNIGDTDIMIMSDVLQQPPGIDTLVFGDAHLGMDGIKK